MVTIAIPLLVLAFLGIHRHYRKIARRLRAGTAAVRAAGVPRNQVLVVADTVDVATESALWYAQRIAHGEVRALHAPGRRTDVAIRPRWFRLAGRDPHLELLDPAEGRIEPFSKSCGSFLVASGTSSRSSSRSSSAAVRCSPRSAERRFASSSAFCPSQVWSSPTCRRSAASRAPRDDADEAHHPDPGRRRQRRFDASPELRAIPRRRRCGAVFFADQAAEAARSRGSLAGRADPGASRGGRSAVPGRRRASAPLSPRAHSRSRRGCERGPAGVVLHGWRRILHNQRALYIKRLLLFEPRVILTSVPYQLFR